MGVRFRVFLMSQEDLIALSEELGEEGNYPTLSPSVADLIRRHVNAKIKKNRAIEAVKKHSRQRNRTP